MDNILNKIAEYTKERYIPIMKNESLKSVESKALSMGKGNFIFREALKKAGLSFICEIKKASPSKGLISPDFPYLDIAQDYEKGGADAISCLTEPNWFLGDNSYLEKIKEKVSIPVLRKDFTVSDYQIFEAKILGADAVLLIVSILDDGQLREYTSICKDLGFSSLVEAHDEYEIERALKADADIIGVNNRNLKDFSVDVNNSARFRNLIPKEVIFVSESGVRTRKDIESLIENKTDAVLIGETLMRAENRIEKLKELKSD